jgi:hypothetical protein
MAAKKKQHNVKMPMAILQIERFDMLHVVPPQTSQTLLNKAH